MLLPFLGPSPLDLSRVWMRQEPDWSIFVQLRLSRTLLGLFSGAALALGGSVFQAMLRDALATPDTLGVSAGASLGAVAAIAMGWHLVAGVSGIWVGALGGRGSGAPRRCRGGDAEARRVGLRPAARGRRDQQRLLGVDSPDSQPVRDGRSRSRSRGGSSAASTRSTTARSPRSSSVVIVAAILVVRRARQWNLLAVGEAWAGTRGGDVRQLLRVGYVAGSLLAASTVALTGPIGFIGLVVPHLVRVRVSADDRVLMPCAFFLGGVLLASCDAVGRVILAPAEVPAGAITACIGGPYLMWLLRRRA